MKTQSGKQEVSAEYLAEQMTGCHYWPEKDQYFVDLHGCGCCEDAVETSAEETLEVLQIARKLLDKKIESVKEKINGKQK